MAADERRFTPIKDADTEKSLRIKSGDPTFRGMDCESLDLLSERVIGAFFQVSNALGAGFLEKVYERALLRELAVLAIRCSAQAPFSVFYKTENVGDYFADIVVEDALIVELKCVDRLGNEHTAQCLNYLKASGMTVCLLVNFSRPKVEWKRVVLGFSG